MAADLEKIKFGQSMKALITQLGAVVDKVNAMKNAYIDREYGSGGGNAIVADNLEGSNISIDDVTDMALVLTGLVSAAQAKIINNLREDM